MARRVWRVFCKPNVARRCKTIHRKPGSPSSQADVSGRTWLVTSAGGNRIQSEMAGLTALASLRDARGGCDMCTGGVAALTHRLMAGIPPGYGQLQTAKQFKLAHRSMVFAQFSARAQINRSIAFSFSFIRTLF